ncbi:phospholipase [Microbacterium sp.]|uniref:aggregation-promoting factor C-terminal-like domain-containing protein n=1 Tax=Microbacterium sp. TaxID=51671 RepID=UPI003F7290AB
MQKRSTFTSVRRARHRSPLLVATGVVVGALLASGAAVGAMAATGEQPVTETLVDVTADADQSLDAARATLVDVEAIADEIDASGLEISSATAIDTTTLRDSIDRLDDLETLPLLLVPALADDVEAATSTAQTRIAQVRAKFDEAVAKKAAADAAAEASAKAAAEAAALAAANTPDGAKATAQRLMAERYGWGGDQFSCLSSLWQKESSWNYQAYNAGSGATGIPQALPGSKMADAGADWQTNAATQIAWGLDYISRAYGSPCAAWGHSQATNWY